MYKSKTELCGPNLTLRRQLLYNYSHTENDPGYWSWYRAEFGEEIDIEFQLDGLLGACMPNARASLQTSERIFPGDNKFDESNEETCSDLGLNKHYAGRLSWYTVIPFLSSEYGLLSNHPTSLLHMRCRLVWTRLEALWWRRINRHRVTLRCLVVLLRPRLILVLRHW